MDLIRVQQGVVHLRTATVETFDSVANLTAFFAVAAGLGGLLGRVIETVRILKSGKVHKDDRDVRLQDATTLGSVVGMCFAAIAAAILLTW